MTGLDISTAPTSHLAVAPPAIAQHQSADRGLVQAEQVEVIRHESFDYEFKGARHLLIASERAERYDGGLTLEWARRRLDRVTRRTATDAA
jgi:hypothetical protein